MIDRRSEDHAGSFNEEAPRRDRRDSYGPKTPSIMLVFHYASTGFTADLH